MNSFERYSLRKKRVLDVCTNVVKDADIRDLLLNKTGCKCEKISMSRYTAVRSKLSRQNYALISNMVIKAVKLICETIYHGEFKDTLDREKDGVRICQSYLLKDKDMSIVEQFNNKMHEFEQRKTEIKTDAFHLIFEYIDYLTLLEESWRRGCVTNILNYNLETRHSLIEEVRLICGLVYKDFIYPNIKNIKESFYKNPDFTSEISGFAGDSNFILGDDLYNLKTKHKSMPSEEDICQSVLYYLMSRCNKKYYKEVKGTFSKDNLINRLYIYNTRFGDKYEIKLNNMSDAYIENIMEEVYSMYNNFKLVKSGLLPY